MPRGNSKTPKNAKVNNRPRYQLRHMLDVAHDYNVGAGVLMGHVELALRVQGDTTEAPTASFIVIAVLSIEVLTKALYFAETGAELRGHDLVLLYKALSPAERNELEREFDAIRAQTGTTLDLATTLDHARDAFMKLRYAYEMIGKQVTLEMGSLRDFARALQTRIAVIGDNPLCPRYGAELDPKKYRTKKTAEMTLHPRNHQVLQAR